MWELQYNFFTQNLFIYYTEAYLPLGHIKNNYEQINDPLPEKIKIFNSKDFPKELKDEEGVLLYGDF